MKINVYFFIVCILACNNIQQQNQPEKKTSRKVDSILGSIIEKYPNYVENTIVREDATNELDKKVDSILNLGYFNDIPLKVYKMENNPYGKGVIIQFHTDNYDYDNLNTLSNRFNFDIIGLMEKDIAIKIKENGKYLVYGKKLKRVKEVELSGLVNQVYFSPQTKIEKDLLRDVYNFNVGVILMEVDSVKMIN